jgi:hypothetical protein
MPTPVILNHQHPDKTERFRCVTAAAASATASNSSVHPSTRQGDPYVQLAALTDFDGDMDYPAGLVSGMLA